MTDIVNVGSNSDEQLYKILYVEDNKANMRLMEHVMRRRDNVVMITADTGELGVERAVNDQPDIILMDINLPGINGYEALEQIRQHAELDNVPVIAISANAMPGDIETGLAAGFYAYVTKPLETREFIRVLNATIKDIEKNKPAAME